MSRPSSTSRALQLPEILHAIALLIPLFEHGSLSRPSSYSYSPFSCFERYYVYTLRHLLPCTLVSRLWNSCFTPHLYHYYIENYEVPLLIPNTRRIKSFQKNHRHSRRYRVFNPDRRGYFSDVRSPETEFLPRELVGLSLYTISESTAKLLLYNQGPQLRQLVWSGNRFGCKMEKIYEDALTNLPCLEQLELNEWHVTNELIYRMLQNCSRTLRELKLKAIAGFDEKLFNGDIDAFGSLDNCSVTKVPGSRSWTLPRLKSLKLVLDDMQSQASVLLPQVCPSLESIRIKVKSKGHPVQQLIAALHEHCPNLHTIHYQRDLKMRDHRNSPGSEINASLFKDSFASPMLRYASMGLTGNLDQSMADALLFHSTTLVALELQGCSDSLSLGRRLARLGPSIERVATLLSRCHNLKELRVTGFPFKIQSMECLLANPWVCQGLEILAIVGYQPSMEAFPILDEVFMEEPFQLELERKRIHQQSHLECRWHEFCNDGQGWFLKPELNDHSFFEACIDSDWKRRLFQHMYMASGVKKAKYVRLNWTDFYATEQRAPHIQTEASKAENLNAWLGVFGQLLASVEGMFRIR
ncbi:hypothetical protein BGX34_003963 [Mortierella sp. NVP85]|nr:hypothetical protein BGX34_003963 [Mortierella sp. NVP85]